MALIINGGAAVTVLAFLGSLASKVDIADLRVMASTIVWFALGVALAVLAMALAYLTNYCHGSAGRSMDKVWEHPYVVPVPSTKRWKFAANVFHLSAFVVGLASLVMFVCGMIQVRDAIGKLPETSTEASLVSPQAK